MKTDELEKVARALSAWLRQTPAGEPLGPMLPALLRLLARGRPVSPDEIAAATGKRPEDVRNTLASMPDAETDDQGNLVGMGLTLRPTPHRFGLGERQLYAWCALDTLMYPLLLREPAIVESPCRATGQTIRIELDLEGVRAIEPAGAVVSIVVPEDCLSIRASFCNEVHFFRSRKAATGWLSHHPGAFVLTVSEAFDVGKTLNDITLPQAR